MPVRMSRSTKSTMFGFGSSSRARRLLTALGVVGAALLGAVPAAEADLGVSHISYAATEVSPSDGDNIIGPGDGFSLTENVQSSNATTLTHVVGALSTSAQGVSVTQATSPYPDLHFGVTTGNTNPFQAQLSPSLDCGVVVPFTLQLTTDQGSQAVSFNVATGSQGAFNAYSSTQVPVVIPSPGQVISSFNLATPGRVKRVKVQIGSLTHNYDGNLRLELIAPDGTDVHLIEPNISNNGQNFTNTTFDDNAATPIASGTAPYSGSYIPAQPLSAFIGHQQQGNWQLKITDTSPGDHGILNSWGTSVAPAVCTVQPLGAFTITPNPAQTGATVGFDASGSTSPSPGATITDYKWDFDVQNGVPNFTTDTGSTPTTSHVYGARGRYTVALQVTDSLGHSSVSTNQVSVTQTPVAAISPSPPSPVSGQPVTFDASGSTHDPAGSIVDYKWDLDGSGNYATDTGSTPHVTTSYSSPQTVSVSVRVTDDVGAQSVATTNVTVNDAPPVASFTWSTPILVGQQVTFNGSGSHDIDGSISDYTWDLDGSGAYATDTGATPTASHTYSTPGPVTIGLRVRDNANLTNTVTHTIQVTRPPVARLTASPAAPSAGQVVTLDASGSSDPDGAIVSYQWDLDGSGTYATSTGQTSFLQHTFAAGTYQLGVRVTDNYGATATASITLTVAPAAGGGGTGGGGGGSLLSQIGPTVGGSPTAGIAALTGSDLKTIAAGTDNHFAAVTGPVQRTAASVAKTGLWVNLVSDRPATFSLTLSVASADAQRLHIARVNRHSRHKAAGLFRVTTAGLNLSAAGQRPFDIKLPNSVRSKLAKLRGRLTLIVSGSAVDANGHTTALSRAFEVRR